MSRSPTTDEAIAIAAAVERFRAETAPVPAPQDGLSPWRRAALAEGVSAKGMVQDHLEGGTKWLS